jgi:hypothetical protein
MSKLTTVGRRVQARKVDAKKSEDIPEVKKFDRYKHSRDRELLTDGSLRAAFGFIDDCSDSLEAMNRDAVKALSRDACTVLCRHIKFMRSLHREDILPLGYGAALSDALDRIARIATLASQEIAKLVVEK